MNSNLPWYAIRIVEYATYDDMRCAMRKLDGTELNGRKLRLIEDYRGHRKRFATECTCVCMMKLKLGCFLIVDPDLPVGDVDLEAILVTVIHAPAPVADLVPETVLAPGTVHIVVTGTTTGVVIDLGPSHALDLALETSHLMLSRRKMAKENEAVGLVHHAMTTVIRKKVASPVLHLGPHLGLGLPHTVPGLNPVAHLVSAHVPLWLRKKKKMAALKPLKTCPLKILQLLINKLVLCYSVLCFTCIIMLDAG